MTAGVYGEITSAGDQIVLAVTGDEYELDTAAKALRRMTVLCKPTEPKGMLLAPLTWSVVTQLGYTFNTDAVGRWMPQAKLKAWIEREFMRRCAPGDLHVWPGEDLVPRPYQVEAACMIGSAGKALIFDDPGCGKTVSAVLGLRERQARGHEIFPMLIVTPSWEVADVWMRHIKMWAPDWSEPALYRGGDRRYLLADKDILVTSYATATLDAADAKGPLVKLRAKSVILDEAHYCKNEKAQRTSAVQRITSHADTFVALTGTPVTRDTGDIFPVLVAMDPASYPARGRFVKRYLDTSDNGYGESVEGLKVSAEPEFRAALAGQYRRVSKADVLPQLPPKIYSTRRIEIPPAWRKAYDQMADEMLAELPPDEDGVVQELPVMSVLAQLTRLGQLASSAADVAVSEEPDELGEMRKHYTVTLKNPCWKAEALLGVLAERPGQQAAVFANSAQLILLAAEAATHQGFRCGLIIGGQSSKNRQADIDAFQNGDADLIFCTAGAGGLGVTLTAASSVIMLQRSWQLDLAVQPEDRAHRLDDIVMKHDAIEIIDIIAKDTVEDRVRTLMREKGGQLGRLVQDPRIVRELLGGLK